MSDLAELYQELILDHGKRPRNFGAPAECSHHAEGYNPLCGDRITVYATMHDDMIDSLTFDGVGCAICTASASLMTEQLKGCSRADAMEFFERFHDLMTGKATELPEAMYKLEVLSGVTKYPMRVKCATLPWHTMKAAVDGASQTATTE